MLKSTKRTPTKTAVIHVDLTSITPQARGSKRSSMARLEEACGLARAISIDLVASRVVSVSKPRPSTLIGGGHTEQMAELIKEKQVQLVIVDAALTPIQQRNLEKAWSCKVIDRTGLILEIFGERARTAEGVLQVELAALSYQRSRLVRSWTHLERQRGGFGFLGGPGESQLELDRRMIDERIIKIKQELMDIKRTRGLHRSARKRVPYPIVALVGYTNAGKSTLFNRLTNSDIFAKDLLFATLDPTMRKLALPSGRDVILSDTVGFISDLPTQLIAAFRATLEEVIAADLIIHVRDISHPDTHAQRDDVEQVLKELGIEEKLHKGQVLTALNKTDKLTDNANEVIEISQTKNNVVPISALTASGLTDLLQAIDKCLIAGYVKYIALIPFELGDILAWCYRKAIVEDRSETDYGIKLSLSIAPEDLKTLKEKLRSANA